jgi:tyrosine-protein phosphatase YwqE
MKNLLTFERFLNESLVLRLKDLIGTRIYIEIGSGTTSGIFTEAELMKSLAESIEHNLFDSDFSANWTSHEREYRDVFKKDNLDKMLKDPNKTLKEFFALKGSNKLVFNMTFDERQKWIDNWFKTNKSISQGLRQDYYDYREEYAGVKLG